MGDDQVVARELEQAEAGLVRSKVQFWRYWLGEGDPPSSEDLATLDDLLSFAIEVGRLRALEEVKARQAWMCGACRIVLPGTAINEGLRCVFCPRCGEPEMGVESDVLLREARVALAAREEVQG